MVWKNKINLGYDLKGWSGIYIGNGKEKKTDKKEKGRIYNEGWTNVSSTPCLTKIWERLIWLS